ncbi:SGNH/GDSL hydrolase family protein [Candidatus Sumerlaeota bacterium]|nr:SGNH/GDSL hydrolase family protein [Candidatus Sumerlaeota bacterium]
MLGLFLSEIMARIVLSVRDPTMNAWPKGYYVASPNCGYHQSKNFPETWMTLWDGTSRNLAYSNSLGMRDVEPPPRSEGQLRILCIGDSMTEGVGITDTSQPWPRQLQPLLVSSTREPAPDSVVVMHGGVVGFNTLQETAHALELAASAEPDVWLMAYFGGQWGMWGRNVYGTAGQYPLKWGAMYNADFLASLLRDRSAFGLRLMDFSVLWRWIVFKTTDFDLGGPPIAHRPYSDPATATREALLQFKEAAEKSAAKPIVAYLPSLRELTFQRDGRPQRINIKVREICLELGLPFLDPMAMLLEELDHGGKNVTAKEKWGVSDVDSHYNSDANAFYARSLAELLEPLLTSMNDSLAP